MHSVNKLDILIPLVGMIDQTMKLKMLNASLSMYFYFLSFYYKMIHNQSPSIDMIFPGYCSNSIKHLI